MTDHESVTKRLLAIPPDESLREAQALVDRYTKTDVHWHIAGLPDALAEIQEVKGQLWAMAQQDGQRYRSVLSAVTAIPPMQSPSLPPGF